MRRVSRAQALPGYRLELEFDDGVSGAVDSPKPPGEGVSQTSPETPACRKVRWMATIWHGCNS